MKLKLKRMSEVDCSEYIALNMHPLVRKQMPLTDDGFDEAACAEWIKGKESIWDDYGVGPWAFLIDGNFAGWGGVWPEEGDMGLGIVLHPSYWGAGKLIYDELIRRAFDEMGCESVTILFPTTRTRVKALLRLGFVPDGEVELYGERFVRYRLYAPGKKAG